MSQTFKFKDEQDLAGFVQERVHPVFIKGGQTRGVDLKHDRVDMAGLSGVVDYEPGALTMVAKAGTTLQHIEEVLKAEGQQLAFEPTILNNALGASGASTIGGVFATNGSGPRRIQAGAARDFLLGVRYVDGHGNVIKNGGRVMKNVTGYDIVKLMAGSWGTLGLLSEVSFKVLPMPAAQATLVISGINADVAVDVMTTSLNTAFDVNGVAYDIAAKCTYVRLEGFEQSVKYRTKSLMEILGAQRDITVYDDTESGNVWWNIRMLAAISDQHGDLWKISVRPTDGPQIVQKLGLTSGIMDWSGGLIWAKLDAGKTAREILDGIPGHVINLSAKTGLKFSNTNPALTHLQDAIREKFDPKGIFNPGLMG